MNEKTSLETHVAVCEERYREIFNRLKRIEGIVWGAAIGLISVLGGGLAYVAHVVAQISIAGH